ncbi:NnrU family protein [Sphingobium algorifonticola]|uniref:MFS transporter n=1 Tax=Sphingobium algorifonticola TaxID=2008318 RepID=A0A437J8J0_9SPHN|nr:NnrU family protein [Sphingobium algorifonticola]RVT41690.1 MFS transporter [Sphingobium algorifonticola]
MAALTSVAMAAAAFVGTHFLLSHPLRRPLVTRLGEQGFMGVYTVVALGTMAWMVHAYSAAPATVPLWDVGHGLWVLVTVIMWLASVLLIGSLFRNPAFPDPRVGQAPPPHPAGVFAITRHPMMWSFALWAIAHMLVFPLAANLVVTAAILVLALVGAALQDRKKVRTLPGFWPEWMRRTSFVPLAAFTAGRVSAASLWPGVPAIAGGTALWLAASWAHMPLAGVAAGIWRWLG